MKTSSPRFLTAVGLGLLLTMAPAQAVPGPSGPVTAGKKSYQTSLLRWRAAGDDFAGWALTGTALTAGGELTLDPATAVPGTDPFGPGGYRGGTFYNGGSFLVGQATSPVTPTPAGFSEAIASWSADTPAGTWIETLIRARVGGRFTKYYNLGVWASDSSTIDRHSVRRQGDADGFVAVDTLILDDKLRGEAFELTFRLFSEDPAAAVPTLRAASLACPAATTRSASSRRATQPGGGRSCRCRSARRWSTRTAATSGAVPRRRPWC